MGTVTLTTEEYQELLKLAHNAVMKNVATVTKATPKRKGKTAPGMAAALKEANRKARKKNGEFRKGFDQRRVMAMAHKIRRSKR